MDVIKHVPTWVFAVFIGLLLLGYQQSRDRAVSPAMLLMLPAAMLLFSFYGVLSAFGATLPAVLVWIVGYSLMAVVGRRFIAPHGAGRMPSGAYFVPGSWLPLAMMMAIFVVKFVVGFLSAQNPSMRARPLSVGIISLTLGLLSGAFAARALEIRNAPGKIADA